LRKMELPNNFMADEQKVRVIAVDLDGTLAEYKSGDWDKPPGEPIPAMVERVRKWLDEGCQVVIFTAREIVWNERIFTWVHHHIGSKWLFMGCIRVTNIKPKDADEFWDDRAVRVERNTGRVLSAVEPKVGVAGNLMRAAETFEERNRLYGENYKHIGKLLLDFFEHAGGFPEIKTIEEASRLNLVISCAAKLQRYCTSFKTGGHKDSAHDLSVYAAMLEELTNEKQ
jgi:hypothetical protein